MEVASAVDPLTEVGNPTIETREISGGRTRQRLIFATGDVEFSPTHVDLVIAEVSSVEDADPEASLEALVQAGFPAAVIERRKEDFMALVRKIRGAAGTIQGLSDDAKELRQEVLGLLNQNRDTIGRILGVMEAPAVVVDDLAAVLASADSPEGVENALAAMDRLNEAREKLTLRVAELVAEHLTTSIESLGVRRVYQRSPDAFVILFDKALNSNARLNSLYDQVIKAINAFLSEHFGGGFKVVFSGSINNRLEISLS